MTLFAEQRKDYRVTLKVRNANLLRAIESVGETPGAIFAEKAGIPYGRLNDLIGCKISPLKSDGEYRSGVISLCEYLNKMPSELFSPEQLEPLETNRAEIELTVEQCLSIPRNIDPLQEIENTGAIYAALENLTKRERTVIEMRFGLDGPEQTYDEIGKEFDVTRERIRQIEDKALRKLRHPNNTRIITGREDEDGSPRAT